MKLAIRRSPDGMLAHYRPDVVPMKLHVLSDLHTEFGDFDPPETDADVVVLAGDIGVGTDGVEWAARQYRKVPVTYVPGNHEYYHFDIGITEQLKSSAPANIHVLDQDAYEIEGVRFLGTTLWTDFKLYGEGEAWFSRREAKRSIDDFRSIRNGARPFTPEDSVRLHEMSRAWLVGELQKEVNGRTVIVTHHLPATPSIAGRYRNDPLNPAFASSLEDIIERYQPELWIHGHTHVACDYEIYGTRVVCNPRGYPTETPVRGFRPGLVVEV
jgi:Icc-related predicted phosphoesterase